MKKIVLSFTTAVCGMTGLLLLTSSTAPSYQIPRSNVRSLTAPTESISQSNTASSTSSAEPILQVKHYIPHKTTVPGFEGQVFQLHVHERIKESIALDGGWNATGKVVLLVHSYSIASIPTFDLNYKDYSWMTYLAARGFDVFSLDLTGYGASTRPEPMNNPCNLTTKEQALINVGPCTPTYPYTLTTLQSDWDDIDAAVDYLRQLRKVDRISIIGVSWGGVRALGYASLNPEKIDKVIVQGVAGGFSLTNPPNTPIPGTPMRINRVKDLEDRWNPTIKCMDQVEPGMIDVVWKSIQASDLLGATWASGVIRSPTFSFSGLTREKVESINAPVLLIGGQFDNIAPPQLVTRLYQALKTPNKVQMTIECTSHFINFESRKNWMYEASYNWLLNQAIAGRTQGYLNVKADGTYDWQ